MKKTIEEKIQGLQDSILLQRDIMIESQAQIRQAQGILEKMNVEYKKAMEKKLQLQESLIEAMAQQKAIQDNKLAEAVEKHMELLQETRMLEAQDESK